MPATLREIDVAAPVVAMFRADPRMTVRQDVPVVLRGQSVSVDLLVQCVDSERDAIIVCEAKRSLSMEVVEQCIRWLEHANQVSAIVAEPHALSRGHIARKKNLESLGIGLMYVAGDRVTSILPSVFHKADTRLLEAAFASSDGSIDPAAGSSSAKRATAARCQWEAATKYLRTLGSGSQYWKSIRRAVPEMRSKTSAQAVKAIDRGEWLEAEYSDTDPKCFWAKRGARA